MEEDQDKLLEEAINVVKSQSFQMQKALDASDMREALKCASTMISEMKTSSLSPRTYYQLYMEVFDKLSRLESYFLEEYRRGRKISDLYEKVQHSSSILPRLYLLVAVGSVYIQTRELPSKAILKDLIEMVKGVQHPLRGLFLRYYLNKVCKDKLPDKGSEYDVDGEGTADAIEFLLTNLSEMNRLWVRMQHTGTAKDKAKREKERNDLRVTVGENIVRLSSLQGISIENYVANVLPKILEVVVSSKDSISQQYLIDCIIQAFPDVYHLHTLEPFLDCLPQLQPTVDIKAILINLLTRLSDYIGEGDLDRVQTVDIFGLIKKSVDSLIKDQAGSQETKALLQLQVAFIRLSLKCYPHNTDNVNLILNSSSLIVEKANDSNTLDQESLKLIVRLLSHPLDTMSLSILSMNHYPKLMSYLPYLPRKQVAFKIVEAVITSKKTLDSLQVTEQLLHFITPLLIDCTNSDPADSYEFEDEQQNVAKLVHLISANEPEVFLQILSAFYERFNKGGLDRVRFSFPPLFFAYLKYLKMLDVAGIEMDLMEILKTVSKILLVITEINPDLAIKLSLQCVLCINNFTTNSGYGEVASSFIQQSITLYTQELSETHSKFTTITLLCGTANKVQCISGNEFEQVLRVIQEFAQRQLKKVDQCFSVASCSHMYFNEHVQVRGKITECLGNAARIARICANNHKNIGLFVGLLNQFLYFYLHAPGSVESELVNGLCEFITNSLDQDVESDARTAVLEAKKYMNNTVKYIKYRHSEGKLAEIVA